MTERESGRSGRVIGLSGRPCVGDQMVAELHRQSAELQDGAADAAEGYRRADVLIEGDQLGGAGEEKRAGGEGPRGAT